MKGRGISRCLPDLDGLRHGNGFPMSRYYIPDAAAWGPCLTVCLMGLCVGLGCNMPDPPILTEPKVGLHYDTKYEKEAKSGKSRLRILDGVWEPYFDTLSEPVCVKSWSETSSTWEILYATNRGRNSGASANTSPDRKRPYNNQVLTRPTFGIADVQLPHRKRGQEPQQTRRVTSPISSGKTESDVIVPAETSLMRPVTSSEFQQRLFDQLARSRQKDVLLFVHGFNVDFESCMIRTAQLGLDIPFNGALIAYSWPTQGGVLNYESDEPVNAASVQPFSLFLAWVLDSLPEDSRLNILVHSMGNRIVLKAINQLSVPQGDTHPVHTVCLCAPDVGVSDYRDLIPGLLERCDRVVLYANNSDSALKISKSLHFEQRSGDATRPVTVEGVELIDCSAVDLSFMGHSYFSGNVSVLADLFSVLKENKSPDQRSHLKCRQSTAGDKYWTFHQHPNRILWSWHFEDLQPSRTRTADGAESGAAEKR